jgi:hypothetical protein
MMVDRKEVIRKLQYQLQWRTPGGKLMAIVTLPRDQAEFIVEDLIHLAELHPNEKTF